MIKISLAIAAATLCTSISAIAAPSVAEKVCIFEAAKKLPAIQRLQVAASSTRALPAEMMAKSPL